MPSHRRFAWLLLLALGAGSARGADWSQFRGPEGQGTSPAKDLPLEWSSKKNVVWRTKLPGPGTSSPVTAGSRVFLTCYTGYAEDAKQPGKQQDLRRHLLCLDRKGGRVLWAKEFEPLLPEHEYKGEGSYHGYAASTPATDSERLYVFFGKSGVYCFDLDGKELWHVAVGKNTSGWGSAASPLLYKGLVIVNASVESGALVALDRKTGHEVWRAGGIASAWNTPVVVKPPSGESELVVSVENWLIGLSPDTGKELWRADGVHRYVVPSVVAHDGIVYAIGGGHTSLAVKAGGRGDVTKTHVVWRQNKGSNVPSPIYHEGHLYWVSDGGGVVHCQEAQTGKSVYEKRLEPGADTVWASPLLADGKLYIVSQHKGTYVVAAGPEYKLLAHNVFADDDSRTNASPAVSEGQILLRSDKYLYCLGETAPQPIDAPALRRIALAADEAGLEDGHFDATTRQQLSALVAGLTDAKIRRETEQLLPAFERAAVQRAHDRLLLAEIKRLGGKATVEVQAPEWLRAIVGDEALAVFGRVVEIELNERTDGHKEPVPKPLSERVTDDWLKHLAGQDQLRRLELSGTAVTSARLAHLEGLKNLERLNLCLTAVDDRGFEHLAGLTKMRRMVVCSSKVTGTGFRHLAGMKQLESINLHSSPADDAGLEAIGRLTSLRRLEIVHTRVTDAGLKHLAGLGHLEQLHVHGPETTANALPFLGQLKELHQLDVYDRAASNQTLEQAGKLPRLRLLALVNGTFDDDGVKHLAGAAALEELSLDSAGVTDASIESLTGLHNLRTLRLGRARITPAGRQRLQALLPRAAIVP
jgi:outer membrane protein assembly factor BamB